jgi:hypothetical protein
VLRFLENLVIAAYDSACRSLGTNRFGFLVSILFSPLVYLLVRYLRRKWWELKREWVCDVVDAISTALVLAVLFVGWHLIWVVPRDVYRLAESTRATSPSRLPAPDFGYRISERRPMNVVSISVKVESWSSDRDHSYLWKHNLDTLTPQISCFDAGGHGMSIAYSVKDRNTIILSEDHPVITTCSLRR